MKRFLAVAGTAVAVIALAACGSSGSSGGSGSGGNATTSAAATTSGVSGSIQVFAAASLTESFKTIGTQFEVANPGTTVTFNFGASSALATQINNGSPADVFASASKKNMDQVVSAGAAASSATFAKNVGEIAVPADNPANITSVNDLANSGVKVAVCQPQVPCGVIAATVFKNAGITVTPVSQEADVKGVLTKVSTGNVDAGIVYVTDVKSADPAKVKGVEIPDNLNASTSYPIASLTKAANKTTADAFVAYVLSPDGQKVLSDGGFAAP